MGVSFFALEKRNKKDSRDLKRCVIPSRKAGVIQEKRYITLRPRLVPVLSAEPQEQETSNPSEPGSRSVFQQVPPRLGYKPTYDRMF